MPTNAADVVSAMKHGSPSSAGETLERYATGRLLDSRMVPGTSATIAASDHGKVVVCESGSATTVTLPATLPRGFACVVIQAGAGTVSFEAGEGATLRNRQSHTDIAGQYGAVTVQVFRNPGDAAAEWHMQGDTA